MHKRPTFKKVSATGEVQGGRQRSPHMTQGRVVPYLRVANVFDGYIDFSDLNRMAFRPSEIEKFRLRKGDILLNEGQSVELVGRSAMYIAGPDDCCYQNTLIRYRAGVETDAEYALQLFRYCQLIGVFSRISVRTNSIAHLGVSRFAELELPFPPLPEQRKIAAILRTWDEAIEKLEALRAAKARLLNYKYATIFHPGSSANSGWPERRIGDFVNPRAEKALPSTEMPLYSLTIEDGITPKTERYNRDFLVKDRGAKTYKIVYPGDIVFNPANLRWGAIARSYVCHPVVVSPIYEVLGINSNKIDLDYLNHALTCPYQIRRFATKVEGTLVERMAVKIDTFLMTKILVPDNREEQVRFSRIFNAMEAEIRTLFRQKTLIERQKRGLMQKLLTGEWRVKVEEN